MARRRRRWQGWRTNLAGDQITNRPRRKRQDRSNDTVALPVRYSNLSELSLEDRKRLRL